MTNAEIAMKLQRSASDPEHCCNGQGSEMGGMTEENEGGDQLTTAELGTEDGEGNKDVLTEAEDNEFSSRRTVKSVDQSELSGGTVTSDNQKELAGMTVQSDNQGELAGRTTQSEDQSELAERTVQSEHQSKLAERTVQSEHESELSERTDQSENQSELAERTLQSEHQSELAERTVQSEDQGELARRTIQSKDQTELAERTVQIEHQSELAGRTIQSEDQSKFTRRRDSERTEEGNFTHPSDIENTVEGECTRPMDVERVESEKGDFSHSRDVERTEAGEFTHPNDVERTEEGEFTHPSDIEKTDEGEFTRPMDVERTEEGEFTHPSDIEKTDEGEFTRPMDVERTKEGEFTYPMDVEKTKESVFTHPREVEREEDCGEGEGSEESDSSSSALEEEADPRVVEKYLAEMNQSCDDINKLENELDEARRQHRALFQSASKRMEELGAKIKKKIQRARPYFDLLDRARKAQDEAVLAARLWKAARSHWLAAKEMAQLAEENLQTDMNHAKQLSPAWQETLSHAAHKVMESEREKTRLELDHSRKAALLADLQTQQLHMEKKFKRSIAKARPYFEAKAELELKLQQVKQSVDDLQALISSRKLSYRRAMDCLHSLSQHIHQARRQRLLLQLPRQPGVGAEADSAGSSSTDLPKLDIEKGVFPSSSTSSFNDEDDEEDEDEESGEGSDGGQQGGSEGVQRGGSFKRSLHRRALSNASSISSLSSSSLPPDSPSPFTDNPQSPPPSSAPAVQCVKVRASSLNTSPPPQQCPGQTLLSLSHGSVSEFNLTSRSQDPSRPGSASGDCALQTESRSHTAQQGEREQGSLPSAHTDFSGAGFKPTPGAGTERDMTAVLELPERVAGDGVASEDLAAEEPAGKSSHPPSSHPPRAPLSAPSSNDVDKARQLEETSTSQSIRGITSVSEGVQKRTDAPVKPLQGVMLLNPCDLQAASTIFHF